MLVTTVTVLIAGASDSGQKPAAAASVNHSSHITPLASGQVGSLPSDLTQQLGNK
jgi:hypothetical protein